MYFRDIVYFCLDFVSPYYYVENMAHIHKKMKKGRPYYYIRETARVDGKPKVVRSGPGNIDKPLSGKPATF